MSEKRKWKVTGVAYTKADGTLVLELKHPKSEYLKHGEKR